MSAGGGCPLFRESVIRGSTVLYSHRSRYVICYVPTIITFSPRVISYYYCYINVQSYNFNYLYHTRWMAYSCLPGMVKFVINVCIYCMLYIIYVAIIVWTANIAIGWLRCRSKLKQLSMQFSNNLHTKKSNS